MLLRSAWVSLLTLVLAAVIASGCTVRGNTRDSGGGGGGGDGDGSVGPGIDGGMGWNPEAGPVDPCSPGCGPEELCGDGEGNGLDDNCNGQVDEGCVCTPGTTRECFGGPPDRQNIGVCTDGIQTCGEFGTWGACQGQVLPSSETCNGADDDCNDQTDDGLTGCDAGIMCPESMVAPPLANFTLRGAGIYGGGDARSWAWTIACPDSVPDDLCPTLTSPNAMDTNVYFTASGGYRVTLTVTLADGSTRSCAWTVYVRGGGLRVELNWDTMLDGTGGTDVDLHLHNWTRNGVDTDWFGEEDCYYANCQPDSGARVDWGLPNSDISNCATAPHGGGAEWSMLGYCANPRLDVDTNGTDGACSGSETNPDLDAFCAPENINIDSPVIGMPYRIMVNYYSDSSLFGGGAVQTGPQVNIYCGGVLRASLGRDPLVILDEGSEAGEANDNWYVADVVFFPGACGLDCRVYPIPVNDSTGAGDMRNPRTGVTDPSDPFGFSSTVPFGPPWSCDYDPGRMDCIPR